MPAYVSPDFITLLLKLFIGQGQAPSTVYMGLTGVTSTDGNGNPTGYAPVAIQTSGLTVGGGTLTVPTQTWTFLAAAGSSSSWFVSDSASGGKIYFSGPLGSGPGGKLAAAAGAGSGGIMVATSDAAGLQPGDTLKLGSSCAGNVEYPGVSAIGADNGGTTFVSCGVSKSHPVGEAWSRDSRLRTFTQGYVETVSAAVSIVSS